MVTTRYVLIIVHSTALTHPRYVDHRNPPATVNHLQGNPKPCLVKKDLNFVNVKDENCILIVMQLG